MYNDGSLRGCIPDWRQNLRLGGPCGLANAVVWKEHENSVFDFCIGWAL